MNGLKNRISVEFDCRERRRKAGVQRSWTFSNILQDSTEIASKLYGKNGLCAFSSATVVKGP